MNDFSDRLAALDAQALRRRRRVVDSPCAPQVSVDGRPLLAFASNDYLGLANDPALIAAAQEGARRYGLGAGASPIVSGHQAPHAALEQRLAAFTGFARALLFSTGYLANLGAVPALAGRGDAIFSDQLNHASLIDAARLSRAELAVYPHRDIAALDAALAASRARRKLIVTDAVFSMDGDIAPLPELLALAERHAAWLLVDDAHGFGLLGPQGRGALAHFGLTSCGPASPRLIMMGTLGKAAGGAGAFVAGAEEVIEWILQKARTYTFSTAEPALIAHALLTAVDLIEQGDARRASLAARIAQLRASFRPRRWTLLPSQTAIQPLVIGGNAETMAVAASLYERGLWTPGIRPPAVPPGSARLRITLSAAHTEAQVARLVEALEELEG
ncbi:MAG: 8-amino-7-oxononanoate synthase [Zoogloeaceae bacterium]|jgi:8-amino-7-oxononanoate synthase|nr:8-amino-7-oxononanoate synthase [Zoogloeaceae bacterium]